MDLHNSNKNNIKPFINGIKKYLKNENFEIIFVCDPCTDNTVEIIEEIALRDPSIRLILKGSPIPYSQPFI